MGVETAAIIGGSVLGATLLQQKGADEAQRTRSRAEEEQRKASEAAGNRADIEERARQARAAESKKTATQQVKGGRASTIATSPLGVTDTDPAVFQKSTLLGQ